MANILIVGFGPQSTSICDQIDTVMIQRGWHTDAATVIWDATTRWCESKKPAPYLVVRHSKKARATAIAKALHEVFSLDIEIEVTAGYLASTAKAPYPPLSPGRKVKTTRPNMALRKEWTDEGWRERKWNVQGTVVSHSDSHGLCYKVRHEDGTGGYYDPSELEIMT